MIMASEYDNIASSLGNYRESFFESAYKMLDMQETLNQTDWDLTDLDRYNMNNAIVNAYNVIVRNYVNNSRINKMVASLQNHVIRNYGSINDFLLDNEILVPQSFADMSNDLGFEINESNID